MVSVIVGAYLLFYNGKYYYNSGCVALKQTKVIKSMCLWCYAAL